MEGPSSRDREKPLSPSRPGGAGKAPGGKSAPPRSTAGKGTPSKGAPAKSAQGKRPSSGKKRRRRKSTARAAILAMLYVILVIGVSVGLACLGWNYAQDVLALNKEPHTATVILPESLFSEKEITVERQNAGGETVEETKTVQAADVAAVADILKEKGLIEYPWVFRLFAKFSRADEKMAAGTYTLNTDMDYRALISSMAAGSASRSVISVTIPEGYNEAQIFQLLEDKGVCTVAELNDMAANHDYKFNFLEDIPLGDPKRLEGYLFPDTYQFYIGEDPLYAINKMLVNFSVMVSADTRANLKEEGKSLQDIITVAAMIEKETDGTDHALIASVIYNRLNHPERETAGYLQIDATLAYINGGNVPTEGDKSIDSPYNTYLYPGLPAGPICNPGSESIWAAMHPKDSSYYYYALGADRFHHFSKTFNEHQNFLNSLPKSN